MSEIEICKYTKDDRMGCIRLLKETFPGLSGEENFAWRFESSEMREYIIGCAKHNDNVVGFISYIPWMFTYDNKQYIGYQGGENAVDKHYLRQGILNRLMEYSCKLAHEKDIDFLFGSGNVPTVKAACNAGYYPVAFFPFHQKLVSPLLKSRSEAKLGGTKQRLNIMLREEKKITPIVNDDYMEWRYSMNPKDYSIIRFEKDNNQALFCVRKRKRRIKKFRINTSDLLILDCQFSSFNDRFIKWAFNSLECLYSRKVMTMSIFFNDNTDRGKAISKHFYGKRSSHHLGLVVLPIKEDLNLNVLLNHNNWDVLPHIVDWY